MPVTFGPCCFCGRDIADTDVDPCSVTVETSAGKWQVWMAHGACFKDRLTKDVPMDLSPAHF